MVISALLSCALGMTPAIQESEPSDPGLAILSDKILTVVPEGQQFINHGVLLVQGSKILAVGPESEVEIPDGFRVIDVGENWLMPGMIDLHCHVGGTFDINDTVYLANPGLRASTAVIPANQALDRALASGVTTVFFIPGSGSNVGGQGVLFKTAPKAYEESILRDPGGLKIAQWGNPERWTISPSKTFENYTIRNILTRGRAYGERWQEFEENGGEQPKFDLILEVFRPLVKGEAQIAVHTQVFQVVLATLDIIKRELNYDVFIDHGTFDGWRAGGIAAELGVNAILGPRNNSMPNPGIRNWVGENPERAQGSAAGYYDMGHRMIGFNTDSPVIPQEELQLQAGLGARFGLPDNSLETVRGLTTVPAQTIGMGEQIGSLAPGYDADILVISGAPGDPRAAVERVFVNGKEVYSAEEIRLW